MKQDDMITEAVKLLELEGMVCSRQGATWDHTGLLIKEIKCYLVDLVCSL